MKRPHTRQSHEVAQLSFLPETEFCLIFPNPNSQEGFVLDALFNKNSLTQIDWLNCDGSWRLAASIDLLRQKGWSIETQMLCDGRKRPIASYSLNQHHRQLGKQLMSRLSHFKQCSNEHEEV